jgi:FtsH-binding integral membrane protein
VFSAFVLYDVQKLIDNAKKKETWDPIDESLDIYLDAINLFKIFVELFIEMQKEELEKKKKD